MNAILANKIKMVLRATLYSTAALCLTGTLMQTFLGEVGLTRFIYLHATLMQAANMLSIFLCSHFADGVKNLPRRAALVQLPVMAGYLLYVPFCVAPKPTAGAFALAAAIGLTQSVFNGLLTVCDYKMPYRVFPVKDYGPVSAVTGIVSALASLGVGTLLSALARRFAYVKLMLFAFPAAALMTLAAAWLTRSLRQAVEIRDQVDEAGEKISFRGLLKTPIFTSLFLPNLCRGVASGVVGILAGLALERGFDASLTALLVTAQSAAMLVTCVIFGLISSRLHPKYVIFAGSVLMLTMPALFFTGRWGFLIVYTVVAAGRNLVDYAVPAALYRVVPDSIAGPYHAWRMVLQSGGTMLGSLLASWIPPLPLLIGAVGMQMVCGTAYLLNGGFRTKRRV